MRASFSRSLLVLVLLPALIGACGRSELFRIRLLAPVTEKQQDFTLLSNNQSTATAKETLKVPVTSGGSIYLIFGTLGLGHTSLVTKIEKETRSKTNDKLLLKETTTVTGRFNELAFVLGENYTFMWGVGAMGGGSLQTKVEYGYSGAVDETLESSFLKGDSTFIVLGHHGSGFETLLGMRMNRFKAELVSTGTSAETLDAAKTIELKDKEISIETTQVQLGIGLTF